MSKKTHVKYTFTTDQPDILLALLSSHPFNAFEEEEGTLMAYIVSDEVSLPKIRSLIDNELKIYYSSLKKETIQYQNWNTRWENSFKPVILGDFCAVRASFHDPIESVSLDLIINPRMAFGTGHHATTLLMMQKMKGIDFLGSNVLDFGCGTGILGILASKLGADQVIAIDIDEEAVANTIENCLLNNVRNVDIKHGELAAIHNSEFDVILANINRNVIINHLAEMRKFMSENSALLISGILVKDRDLILLEIKKADLKVVSIVSQDGWLCMHLS